MRVIGTTQKGFVVEMTDDELCQIVGVNGAGGYGIEGERTRTELKAAMGKDAPREKIRWVGLEIPVGSFFAAARRTAEGWNEQYELKQAISFLSTFKAQLEMLIGVYKPQPKENTNAE